ncbi:hypothetical protein E6B08_05790 [Pseudomonas putida]|uniref:Uncharacterized protein n=1 Tax=Pseudomonas putida TaxID=303 RepID=A0A4D6X4I7_PSEPU|nr:hypothetical protein E6B08_05790 [Pseudomonas putida]
MRLSNERPIIAIDRCHICLYLAHATCGFFGETGQVPTVEVPRQRPRLVRGRFYLCLRVCELFQLNLFKLGMSTWIHFPRSRTLCHAGSTLGKDACRVFARLL